MIIQSLPLTRVLITMLMLMLATTAAILVLLLQDHFKFRRRGKGERRRRWWRRWQCSSLRSLSHSHIHSHIHNHLHTHARNRNIHMTLFLFCVSSFHIQNVEGFASTSTFILTQEGILHPNMKLMSSAPFAFQQQQTSIRSSRTLTGGSSRSSTNSSTSSKILFASSSPAPAPTPSPAFRKRSKSWIVIVDDEETIRLSLGNYLYDAGYSVTACADAEALLEILSSISRSRRNSVYKSIISRLVVGIGTLKKMEFQSKWMQILMRTIFKSNLDS